MASSPMSLERWEEISPPMARYMRDDLEFINVVTKMIELSLTLPDITQSEDFRELLEESRSILSRMYDFPVTNQVVFDQLVDTHMLITDPEQYYALGAEELGRLVLRGMLEPQNSRSDAA